MTAGEELDCGGQIGRAFGGYEHAFEVAGRRKRQAREQGSEHGGCGFSSGDGADAGEAIEGDDVTASDGEDSALGIGGDAQHAVEGALDTALGECVIEDVAGDLFEGCH